MNVLGEKSGIRSDWSPPAEPQPIELRIANEQSAHIDRIADYVSDWLSPILVKETRQSLKSRQFFWTFFLLLAAVTVWTLIGLTINRTSVDDGGGGPTLLAGYWIILGFPLIIVVPFSAYRSLAREYEEGTIQLIAVTTMTARQIIAGKLGSNLLQMLIYLSVLAPCIAFTYLLPGLSIPQIVIGLAFCISACFGLSSIALFFAGASRSKMFGVSAAILLLMIQFLAYWLWCVTAFELADGGLVFMTRTEGQFLTLGAMAAILSTGLLMLAAASGLISFASDNRSTWARIAMLIQQTLFIGWSISMLSFFLEPVLAPILTAITAHYWLIMGFAMIGEDNRLSHRVRRSIPQTGLTRSMFSFFLPGSGRGLIFATLNIWFCGLVFSALILFGQDWLPEPKTNELNFLSRRQTIGIGQLYDMVGGVVSICLFASFFLAVTYLLVGWLRRYSPQKVNSFAAFAVGAVIVMFFTGIPLLYHYNILQSDRWPNHTTEQIFNGYWTSIEIANSGFNEVDPLEALMMFLFMQTCGLFALVLSTRELLQTGLSVPDRVQHENQELQKYEPPALGESIDEIFAVERHEQDAGAG